MSTELTLRDYLDILRRRAWIVALCLFGALVIALLWSALQTPMYQSSARILINQNTANDIFDPVTGAATNAADRVATNEVELLKSQLVRTEAEGRLGFEADVGARAESRADIVVVSAIDDDPVIAQRVAQTYSEAYLEVRRNEFIAERLETAEKLLERIRELEAEIAALGAATDTFRQEALRDDLADSYDRLVITAGLGNNGSARIIDDADLPEGPFTPRTNRNIALGGVLGLMIGAGSALLLESLDRSIKSRHILEELTPGVPALASIPATKSQHAVISLERPDGVESEVFRTLRAGIEFAAIDRPIKVIQITSPGASAGKTTVAANLAVVMAQTGQKVAVVDGDLRRPRLHTVFGLDQDPGITSVIIGRAKGAEASHALRLNNGRLWVFPSGPIPPGPSELLGSERAKNTFAGLRRSLDVIIVDSPPVLPVADALVMSRLVDATVVVANARATKREDLLRAVDQLEQAGANVIGTVLNQVKANANHGYGYGYGYGYGDSASTGLFGRSKSVAPRLDGTATLKSSELPRFEAARAYSGVEAELKPTTEANVQAKSLDTTPWLDNDTEGSSKSGKAKTIVPASHDNIMISDIAELADQESIRSRRDKRRAEASKAAHETGKDLGSEVDPSDGGEARSGDAFSNEATPVAKGSSSNDDLIPNADDLAWSDDFDIKA